MKMTKSCVNCRWEPEWKLNNFFDTVPDFEAGKCKYPMPPNTTPYVGKDEESLYFKDSAGKYIVEMCSTTKCYAWEPKPAK